MTVQIIHGDCLDVMRGMPAASIDSVVTDPPAGISFMGRDWDHHKGGRDQWIAWMQSVAAECLRVCKPGSHALVWALPRTSHWTATAWENAGWEVRDRVSHLFGSGFPKSQNVGKAFDWAAGAEREVVGEAAHSTKRPNGRDATYKLREEYRLGSDARVTAPATDLAKQWDGWGSALKPAVEDWWLLRRPLAESSIAANVAAHGTGAINIEKCRVEAEQWSPAGRLIGGGSLNVYGDGLNNACRSGSHGGGRWPANVCHDGSDEVLEAFARFGERPSAGGYRNPGPTGHVAGNLFRQESSYKNWYAGDTGTAARFFYTAKASRTEREIGAHGFPLKEREARYGSVQDGRPHTTEGYEYHRDPRGNHHPTVKPLALMQWLCRLVTPPGGTVLDPFAGSGSTLIAADREQFNVIGIEREAEYVEIMRRRVHGDAPLLTKSTLCVQP